jgi:FxsC-like protein
VPEYAENGLRALCRHKGYRSSYHTILKRLAERIVAAAESCPLGPSPATPLSIRPLAGPRGSFAFAVLAGTAIDPPLGRTPAAYGERPSLWRPFAGDHALPAAQFAADVAERLGLPPHIVDFDVRGAIPDSVPGLLLVDPWTAADGQRIDFLSSAVDQLRDWVIPVVVSDPADPQYAERGADLSGQVLTMLSDACARACHATGPEEFQRLLPSLVAKARRTQLRTAKFFSTAP